VEAYLGVPVEGVMASYSILSCSLGMMRAELRKHHSRRVVRCSSVVLFHGRHAVPMAEQCEHTWPSLPLPYCGIDIVARGIVIRFQRVHNFTW
jgi:hypothetical protein